jgi:hypothetical protein
MKGNDSQLKEMFVRATDEVTPAAPWLESRIVDAALRRGRMRRHGFDLGALGALGPGMRLTAGVVTLLLALGTVAGLLIGPRLFHNLPVPGSRSTTIQSPGLNLAPFTPSPAVRASSWPPGGPVPTQLAGAWAPAGGQVGAANSTGSVLHVGGYTWEFDDNWRPSQHRGLCGGGNHCYSGNVVVNGSEIDFIDATCTVKATAGFQRFTYVITGNTLVLTPLEGPGQSSCIWVLAGTYSRVS